MQNFIIVALGMAIGAPAALGCGRIIQSKLFGLAIFDPPTFTASMLVVAAVAALAGYLPAKRASRVDPLLALRRE